VRRITARIRSADKGWLFPGVATLRQGHRSSTAPQPTGATS